MQTKLGQKLRDERTKLKMTQCEFAEYLGIKLSTYERLENDRNNDIRLDTMISILRKIYLPLELFIPIEILNKYYTYTGVKKETDAYLFLSKEFTKLMKKLNHKFKKYSK